MAAPARVERKVNIVRELIASVVVFLVALPLCMGIAIASGVPPALGLITGIVGGIVVGFLAGSPLQVSGPAAGLAVIIYELVREHGIEMLGPILLLAGIFQMLAGVARVGQWFRAMSPAVVYGMLAGIGVLLVAAQFHVMVDDKPRSSGLKNLVSIPESIYKGVVPNGDTLHQEAAIIGLSTIAVLLLWNKFRPKALKLIPGALVAVIVGTVMAVALGWPIQRVTVPANLLEVVRWTTPDLLARMLNPTLLVEALALAVVASAETLLSAAAVDKMHTGPRTNFDRELTAQGVGNLICGIFGALPMTGVIVRSSANVQAGAQSRLSTILHGTWLLAFVAALPWVLALIPTACLAAILVYTGYKLVNIDHIRKLRQYGYMPLIIYVATLVGIVALDLLTGVLIGLGLTLAKIVYKATHLKVVLTLHPERNSADLMLEGIATFIRLPAIAKALDQIPRGSRVNLHAEYLLYIDHTCLDLLYNFHEQQQELGGGLDADWEQLRRRYNEPVRRRTPTPAAVR